MYTGNEKVWPFRELARPAPRGHKVPVAGDTEGTRLVMDLLRERVEEAGVEVRYETGAAALVLMTADEAAKRGATILGRIAGFATCGVDPSIMGTGPIPASRKALEKAGWSVGDLDLVDDERPRRRILGRNLGVDLGLGGP